MNMVNANTAGLSSFNSSTTSSGNPSALLSSQENKLEERDVKVGDNKVSSTSPHLRVQYENADTTKTVYKNENLVNRNLQSGSQHDYNDDGPQPLKPIGGTTKPTDKAHIKGNDYNDDGPPPLKPIGGTIKPTDKAHIKGNDYNDDGPQPLKPIGGTIKPTDKAHMKGGDYDDDGPQPLKPIGGTTKPTDNVHIKGNDYNDDGPQPLKPIGGTTKPTDKAHIKGHDYNDDGPPPLKPMGVITQPKGDAPPINQPEQLQKPDGGSSVQDLDSGSGNKKVKSDERTKLLEEPLKPLEPKKECCSCVIL